MPSETSSLLDFRVIFESAPGLYLVLAPDFTIVAVTDAYTRATMTSRESIVGRGFFDVFPNNPLEPVTSIENLRISLERVLALGRPDAMPIHRYDVHRPASEGGGFEERYWSPLSTPVLDASGKVQWIIHRVDDVTELVRAERKGKELGQLARVREEAIQRLQLANAELAKQKDDLQKRESIVRNFCTPVLQLPGGILLMPIIGILDDRRVQQVIADMREAIRAAQAKVVVIDIAGVAEVTRAVVSRLVETADEARLMSATAIVTGLPPVLEQSLMELDTDLGQLTMKADLQSGVRAAERFLATGSLE